jgi:NADH:ubiquinone oxidoreductase subunit 3 (subunit A)
LKKKLLNTCQEFELMFLILLLFSCITFFVYKKLEVEKKIEEKKSAYFSGFNVAF